MASNGASNNNAPSNHKEFLDSVASNLEKKKAPRAWVTADSPKSHQEKDNNKEPESNDPSNKRRTPQKLVGMYMQNHMKKVAPLLAAKCREIEQMPAAQLKQVSREVRLLEVFDDKATRRGMQQARSELQDTAPEDVVVIYYAGHGEATEEDFFFVTYEFELPLSASRLQRRALSASSMKDYIEKIGARRVIMLIDACKSGTAVAGFQDQMDRRVIRRLGQSVGLHIVSATAKEQFAVEHAELGHGVFTYALIEAMEGKADTDPRDGNLTVREVVHFLEEEVPALSQKYASYQHWPLIYSRGLDFTLGKVASQ